jgi:hypothetical protein
MVAFVRRQAQQHAGNDSSSGADWWSREGEERSRAGGRQNAAVQQMPLSPVPGALSATGPQGAPGGQCITPAG